MLKRVTTIDGHQFLVNPDNIERIVASMKGRSIIYFTGKNDGVAVSLGLDDLEAMMQTKPTSRARKTTSES